VDGGEQWVSELKRGDSHAFELLVDRFEGPLYRFFFASHGDAQLAGEQSVDCFSQLVSAITKMNGGADQLRPFVFAVARNILRHRWRQLRSGPNVVQTDAEMVDPRPNAEIQCAAREELEQLLVALRELDSATRDVFLLRYVEQMSLPEVARTVGEPLGTVKCRIHRGRIKLEQILGTEYEHER